MSSRVSICEHCGAEFAPSSGTRLCPNCTTSEVAGHEMHEIIGSGGMGAVHRARQNNLQRDVALKIIVPDRMTSEDRERFLREARVLAQLDHPNIVPVYDFGRDADGRTFYTMKLVRGRTLMEILARVHEGAEKWTLERLIGIFRKVCDAVAFAHSRGVLHRDLKPANIMVGEFGEVLVMDWGLARDIRNPLAPATTKSARGKALAADVELTFEGEVVGTPQYMSPEQAEGDIAVDERSDVYALGGILYTILTLRPPVPKGPFAEVVESVRTGRIEPFTLLPQLTQSRVAQWRIPPGLAAVVRKAMAREREARFRNVPALAADVDAHLAGYATSSEEIGFAGLLWLLIKRHRTISMAALVLFVVSAAFVVRLIESEQRAKHSAQIAGQNEDAARQSEQAAKKAEHAAQENETAARAALAQARIALADRAFLDNDSPQMRGALDAVPEDLRDIQWRYLDARADERQALLTWQGDGFLIGSTPLPSKPGVFAAVAPAVGRRVIEFDGKTGKALRDFPHRGGWVRAVAYSPDEQIFALGRIQNGGISIHRATDGRELLHWKESWVDQLAFMPDGKRLLQGDFKACTMWDATTGRKLWRAERGMTHYLLPGERIASVGETEIEVLAAEDARVLASYPIKPSLAVSAALSPDGERLIVAQLDGQISGFRLSDGTVLFETPAGTNAAIQRMAFTPDGKRFISVASMRESAQYVQVHDAATGPSLRSLHGGLGGIESMSIHPRSGDTLITGQRSATWALPHYREPSWSLAPAPIPGGFFGGDDLFLVAGKKVPLAAVEIQTGVIRWQPPSRALTVAAVSGDGLTAATQISFSQKSSEFVVFRAEGDEMRESRGVKFLYGAWHLALNRDGSRIAISGSWGDIAAQSASNGEALSTINGNDIKFIFGLAWHGTDPKRLLGLVNLHGRRGSPAAEEWITAWDTDSGKVVAAERNATPMNCLAVEPAGARLAEAGDDKLVRIRDAGTLAVVNTFRAHDGPINAIAWNPKRPMIATGSADRTVRLWDAETGRLIEEVHIGMREPKALFFSPSGRRLACITPGERTLIWELPE